MVIEFGVPCAVPSFVLPLDILFMMRKRDFFAWIGSACAAKAAVCLGISTVSAAGLNDTGQTLCYDAANAPVACSAAVGGDAGVNPRQDGRFGRDARAAKGQVNKVGAGAAGFDYTKIANNGTTLAASTTLGSDPASWACTKDNVTGLVWEIKTSSGLRSSAHTYTWYSADAASNGANVGGLGANTCGGSLAAAPYNDQCNTQNFLAAVNAASLCGTSDWRLPSPRELLSIVHAGNYEPSIETAYFPNTSNFDFWSAMTYPAFPVNAWAVKFRVGTAIGLPKTNSAGVLRLVRGGQ